MVLIESSYNIGYGMITMLFKWDSNGLGCWRNHLNLLYIHIKNITLSLQIYNFIYTLWFTAYVLKYLFKMYVDIILITLGFFDGAAALSGNIQARS